VLGASLHDKVVPADMAVRLLEAVLEPGDRVCMEGNNQKQADFLAQALTRVDPARVNKLHMLQSVLALPEHLDLYELGIAEQLDFPFSGPQAAGDLSTRVELFYELMTCKKKKFTPVPFNHYK
jgi:malonate decarboxylase alpha subunit